LCHKQCPLSIKKKSQNKSKQVKKNIAVRVGSVAFQQHRWTDLKKGLNTYLENIRNIFSNIVIFCNGILLNVGLPHRPVALWV
jgi:hypothetical protein